MEPLEKKEIVSPVRLDRLLVVRRLIQSRDRAKNLIKKGVLVNGIRIFKPDAKVPPNAKITIEGEDIPWVSRGGLKLEKAFKLWKLSVKDLVCLDIGASTGGFTDVLLSHGAKKVYALDVGHGQLVEKLRNDPRVVNMEGTHINDVDQERFTESIDFICIDVSFISLDYVLPLATKLLNVGGTMVALIKPEFEMGKKYKTGVVRDPEKHIEVVNKIKLLAKQIGLEKIGLAESPILGGKGNKEFLIYLKKSE